MGNVVVFIFFQGKYYSLRKSLEKDKKGVECLSWMLFSSAIIIAYFGSSFNNLRKKQLSWTFFLLRLE